MKNISPRTERVMLWVITAGLLLIVAGTLMPLLSGSASGQLFRYIYTAGAIVTVTGRLFTPYRGDNLRIKRLYRIEAWSSIFFCVAAFFLFYDTTTLRDWLAFTLAGGCIQGYASFMIPRLAAKSASNADQHPGKHR